MEIINWILDLIRKYNIKNIQIKGYVENIEDEIENLIYLCFQVIERALMCQFKNVYQEVYQF